MNTQAESSGRARSQTQIVFDQDYGIARPFDGLSLDASGNVSIQCVDNAAPITRSLDKGWHPYVFRKIAASGTTLIASQVYGTKSYKSQT